MKIKRVFAKDMRQGIRRVREELGEDAVILSNRKVDDGVEIVVGIDYDDAVLSGGHTQDTPRAPATSKENQMDIFSNTGGTSVKAPAQKADFKNAIHSASEELESMLNSELSEDLTYSKPNRRPQTAVKPQAAAKPSPAPKVYETRDQADDGLIDEMRSELKSLRGILENQLSGLAWGEMSRNRPNQASLLKRYMDLGISSSLSQELVEAVAGEENLESAWRMSLNLLAEQLSTPAEDFIAEGGVVALVGPTGVGKTTSVAKLAARYALQHGYQQVALVTTDSYRIGAHEQLRTYGRILGIPVRVANDADELKTVLESLADKRLVLIDTAGMSQRDLRLTEQFASVLSGAPKLKTCVVLSANTQTAALEDVMRAFSKVKLDACILTKLDESVSLGGILSVLIQHKMPVAYVSDGQQVPEDIHRAHPHTLVNRALGLLQDFAGGVDEQSAAIANGGWISHAK